MSDHSDALARTTLLLNQELFAGGADEEAIADALLGSTVQIAADEANLVSRAGQATLLTAFTLTARLGIGIELAAPNVELLDMVAPLHGRRLVDALVDLGDDLVPGALVRLDPGAADGSFVLGDANSDAEAPVRVTATDFTATIVRQQSGERCSGDLPLGGFAAGAATAALALEAALPRIEAAVGRSARTLRPTPGPPVNVDLREVLPELRNGISADIGAVDSVSGGAITHALLFCLLRVPGLSGRVRVMEEQSLELSNVNRYALMRRSETGKPKTENLEAAGTARLRIDGVRSQFTKDSRPRLLPFADRVVVGVDDVEARWWVQQEAPAWLCVGASGNNLAQMTAHVPGGPCSGCAHPEVLPPQTIPTISFVSFWAGLLQACALLCDTPPTSRGVMVYPFALGGEYATHSGPLVPNARCAISCAAAREVASS